MKEEVRWRVWICGWVRDSIDLITCIVKCAGGNGDTTAGGEDEVDLSFVGGTVE